MGNMQRNKNRNEDIEHIDYVLWSKTQCVIMTKVTHTLVVDLTLVVFC